MELHGGRSPLSADDAAKIIAGLPGGVTSVVVTSVAESGRLIELAQTTGAKILQLYGDATPETILEVKAALPAVQIWKVINVSGTDALQKAQTYESVADALALDSAPKAGRRGGTGETHDWNISKKNRRVSRDTRRACGRLECRKCHQGDSDGAAVCGRRQFRGFESRRLERSGKGGGIRRPRQKHLTLKNLKDGP